MDITQLQKLRELKYDPIYTYDPHGADWDACRLCHSMAYYEYGKPGTIEHEPDCLGVWAEEQLAKSED